MPVYDYVCGACGHLLEVIHGIHAEGPRFCPSCGAEGRMRKAVVAPAVVFRGSGWAKKDRNAAVRSGKSTSDAEPASPDKGTSDKATSDKATSDKATSDKATSDKAASDASRSSDSTTSAGSGSGASTSSAAGGD